MLENSKKKTFIVGFQGGQGTGKSTLCRFLKKMLDKEGYKTLIFSLDDFYLSYADRVKLKKRYPGNELYLKRGLPGTHRVRFLEQTLNNIQKGRRFVLPMFDKSLKNAEGDISKEVMFNKKFDFVLFEGWCLGLPETNLKELKEICHKNKISLKFKDDDLKTVISKINDYHRLWKYLDYLVTLKPDSADLHKKWRLQQEKELKKETGIGMTKAQIDSFVEMFLPFTYLCYEKINPEAKVFIDKRQYYYKVSFRK